MRAIGIGAVLLTLCVLVVSGTATAQRAGKWDPAALEKGQYLTEEQYSKLKAQEAAAYCEDMQRILDGRKSQLESARADLGRQQSEVTRLRNQIKALDEQMQPLQNTVASMEREYGPYRNKAFSHTVVKGEFLSKIAGYPQIYGDTMKWPRLYRANRDQIQDPNLIYPKQVLKVPQGYPKWHMVVEGEFLGKIAGYWEIYNSGKQWPRIYEANKDQIRDPDLIYPKQVLTIPR